jgi:hypothetical protein
LDHQQTRLGPTKKLNCGEFQQLLGLPFLLQQHQKPQMVFRRSMNTSVHWLLQQV